MADDFEPGKVPVFFAGPPAWLDLIKKNIPKNNANAAANVNRVFLLIPRSFVRSMYLAEDLSPTIRAIAKASLMKDDY
jgi:hypothetical protein